MEQTNFERSCVALYLWRKHREKGLEACVAIALCLRNQMMTTDNGWLETLPTDPGGEWPNTNDPFFRRLLVRIDGVFDELVVDNTNGATGWEFSEGKKTVATVAGVHLYA